MKNYENYKISELQIIHATLILETELIIGKNTWLAEHDTDVYWWLNIHQ